MTSAALQEHLPFVESVAKRVHAKCGHIRPGPDFDDLVAFGSKGLIEAAGRFDPSRKVSFQTFAYYRIRGAMMDGVRAMGAYSRTEVARHRENPEASFTFADFDDTIPANDVGENPEERLDRHRMSQAAQRLLDRLPEAKRSLVRSYFFGGLHLDEIGALRGQSKSWICRLLAQTLAELHAGLIRDFPDAASAHNST